MAQQKVSEALAGVGKADNAFATLANFEKTVAKQEATAKAFGELASAGKDDSLEAETKREAQKPPFSICKPRLKSESASPST